MLQPDEGDMNWQKYQPRAEIVTERTASDYSSGLHASLIAARAHLPNLSAGPSLLTVEPFHRMFNVIVIVAPPLVVEKSFHSIEQRRRRIGDVTSDSHLRRPWRIHLCQITGGARRWCCWRCCSSEEALWRRSSNPWGVLEKPGK